MTARCRRRLSARPPLGGLCGAVLLALAAVALLARPAGAYLDPGTGSYLLQMLAAVVLGAGVALKIYWRKITAFISSRRNGRGDKSQNDV